MPSGSGTEVYQRRQSSPSRVACCRPGTCASDSGSSRPWRPCKAIGANQAAMRSGALQGGGPRHAVGHRETDLVEAFQPIPEHIPLLALDAAVGFVEIELVDLVVGARAPEQLRRAR